MTDSRNQSTNRPVGWHVSTSPVGYEEAVAAMEARVAAIARSEAGELVWLLEHPPLYTAGTSADPRDLIAADRFPVYAAGRGGQYTYHGPGQRIAYVMVDVKARMGGDVRAFVCRLERWVIDSLDGLGVIGRTRNGRVGVWVERPERGPGVEDKIAALGIRIRRGISFHGVAVNVACDLEHYAGIVPCGITQHGVTSLADLGKPATLAAVDAELRRMFEAHFAATTDAPDPRET
ncbi:MAG: lipoyl(octanoyl) transferase LipB [Hyphomicrobiaceae bacterium]|nr:lipoyl(octanoyl) transferase LipB [Hyphomicrobiaceae bacterium]